MTTSSEIPQYRVLTDTFIAPRMVLAGSIIETHGSPGAHLQPLNQAAVDKMEAWYDEDYPTVDKDGRPDGGSYKPHERFRIRTYEAGEVHEVNVLAEPAPADMTGSMSLAQVDQRQATDQRPGPALIPKTVPASGKAVDGEPGDGTKVIESAKPTGPSANVQVK